MSCKFILHDFRLAHFIFIPAGFPQQIPIISVLVHVRIGSASLSSCPTCPPRLSVRPDRLGWVPVGPNGILSCIFLSLCVDISFAVDVRSIPLDGVVAVSYELVIYNFTVPCIQSAHIFLYPVSLYQLLAGLFLSSMSRRPFSMDLLLDHISLLPDYYPLLKDDMRLAHHVHHGSVSYTHLTLPTKA